MMDNYELECLREIHSYFLLESKGAVADKESAKQACQELLEDMEEQLGIEAEDRYSKVDIRGAKDAK